MKAAWLALLFVLPGVAAQVPEQAHVTLTEGGLVVHAALVGVPFGVNEEPTVEWTLDGEPQPDRRAQPVGVVGPSLSDVGDPDGLSTYVYAAELAVPAGGQITYRIGSTVRGFTPIFEATRPVDDAVRFVAYGDIGIDQTAPDGSCSAGVDLDERALEAGCPAHAVRDLALAQDPDLLVIPGDLAYANERLGWDTFMRFMEPIQATVPTMAAIGNHEWADGYGYGQFLSQYVLPGDEQWFMFDAGPVTFIVLNSDGVCGDDNDGSGPPQDPCRGGSFAHGATAWLDGALAAAKADENPWTVVMFHHPPYSWGRHGEKLSLQMLWSPKFEAAGVDIVLTAHDHLYSRSHSIVDGEPTQQGPVYASGNGPLYVVLGGGGRGLYSMPPGDPPAWHAHGEEVHHVGVFEATQDALAFTALRVDGSAMDSFRIVPGTAETEQGDAERDIPWLAPIVPLLVAFALRRR